MRATQLEDCWRDYQSAISQLTVTQEELAKKEIPLGHLRSQYKMWEKKFRVRQEFYYSLMYVNVSVVFSIIFSSTRVCMNERNRWRRREPSWLMRWSPRQKSWRQPSGPCAPTCRRNWTRALRKENPLERINVKLVEVESYDEFRSFDRFRSRNYDFSQISTKPRGIWPRSSFLRRLPRRTSPITAVLCLRARMRKLLQNRRWRRQGLTWRNRKR